MRQIKPPIKEQDWLKVASRPMLVRESESCMIENKNRVRESESKNQVRESESIYKESK